MDRAAEAAVRSIEDAEVVARIRAGDRDAFRVLVLRYQDLLYRHALRMCSSADTAADLVQTAFVRAFADIERCREPAHFRAWLFRILTNACKDHLKSAHTRFTRSDDIALELVQDNGADPLELLERRERAAILHGALAQLAPAVREAFVLKHLEGLDYEEMQRMTDVSVSALKMRVHRAREALREVLMEVLE